MSVMTGEEKKAMIHIKEFLYKDRGFITADECEIFFNYISNLQKENEELKETLKCTQDSWFNDTQKLDKLQKELDKKDKVIDNLYSDIEYEYQGTHYLKSLEEYYEEVEKVGEEDE